MKSLVGSKKVPVFLRIIVLTSFLVLKFSSPTVADLTLEILDLPFPEICGASLNEDITTCPRCHVPGRVKVEPKLAARNGQSLSLANRTITSLEKDGLITVSVPADALKPGQPFIQEIVFNSNRIMYQYGYRRVGSPFHLLDSRWIHKFPKQRFAQRHDGKSMPLLTEPGDYIFRLKLLHDRSGDPWSGYRWEEVVLIWTLSVGESN